MKTIEKLTMLPVILNLFAGTAPDYNPNATTSDGLSVENKTFYEKALIELAEAELIHDQFGQVKDIPANGGKTIEFRQFDQLPELTTALDEGVTPDGQSMSATSITATVSQYGGYVTITDMLEMTAIDPTVLQALKLCGSQAGRTLDTITREVLNAGTVVQYGGTVSARSSLHYTSATNNCNITVETVKKAVRFLEKQNAPKIKGYYIGIIHPDVKFDLMNDPEWKKPHEYKDTEHLYKGEIGELYGVRFVQSSRAKVWEKAGASNANVYSTLILADDAYGTTKISNGGLQHIVKQKGSGGTADPLEQRATVGWKATKTAEILVPQYIVRIESTATP